MIGDSGDVQKESIIEIAADIGEGMEVFASGGDKLGTVNQLWPQAADVVTGVITEGYFSVHEGGLLGLGGRELYVPFAAVDACVLGKRVTLNVTKVEAEARFEHKPDVLTGEG